MLALSARTVVVREPSEPGRWGSKLEDLPKVSVIVPAHNEGARVGRCLEALQSQSYPSASIEILLVDNNSTDDTADIARRLGVTCLTESIQNAENARNTGARSSSGSVLAFTDADCIADADWIESGVAALRGHDLVAGFVQFTPGSARWSLWQTYDAVFNLQHEESVRDRGVAFTANLFLPRSLYDSLGGFPEDSLGGGDFLLTRRASEEGRSLGYEPRAIVAHPARSFSELRSKARRIGAEKAAAWKRGGSDRVEGGRRTAIGKPHFVGALPEAVQRRMERQGLGFAWGTYLGLLGCNLVYLAFGLQGWLEGLLRSPAGVERVR